ncbi:hypothetical protein CK228_28590 [Mesorhizobium sp. WSM4312]|nr:hypothetical protein CK228_28590 [Mesorhizobium sp. WSM4312]PBC20207.1 hypothetical protein CK226_26105 [Mesorhizobium sp. WSM4311]
MLEQALKPANAHALLLKEAIEVAMSEHEFRTRSSRSQVALKTQGLDGRLPALPCGPFRRRRDGAAVPAKAPLGDWATS